MLINFSRLLGILCLFSASIMAQPSINSAEKLLKNGEIEEAKQIFVQYKESPVAMEYLGDISCFNRNWDEAIKYYQFLVDMNPDNAMYNFKLGGAMGMKAYYGSRVQAALLINDVKKYLKTAAELDPTHLESRRALVELYMQIPGFLGGSQTIAESYASDLGQLNQLDALLAQAYIYKVQDFKKLAKIKYEEAIRLAGRKPGLITRNYLKYELGEASAVYKIELEAGSRFLKEYLEDYGYRDIKSPAWAFLRLAQINRLLENQAEAITMINKSLEHDPDFDKALVEKQRIQRL